MEHFNYHLLSDLRYLEKDFVKANEFAKFNFDFEDPHHGASDTESVVYLEEYEDFSDVLSVASDDTFPLPAFVLEDFDDDWYSENPPNTPADAAPSVQERGQVQPPPPQASASKETLYGPNQPVNKARKAICVLILSLMVQYLGLAIFKAAFVNASPLPLRTVDNIAPQFIRIESPALLQAEHAAVVYKLLGSSQPSDWDFGNAEPIQSLCSIGAELEDAWASSCAEVKKKGGQVGGKLKTEPVHFMELSNLCHDIRMGLTVHLPGSVGRVSASAVYGTQAIKTARLPSVGRPSTGSERKPFEDPASNSPPTSSTHQLHSDLTQLSDTISDVDSNLDQLRFLLKRLITEERLTLLDAPGFYLRRLQAKYDGILDRLDAALGREQQKLGALGWKLAINRYNVDRFLKSLKEARGEENKMGARAARQLNMGEKVSDL